MRELAQTMPFAGRLSKEARFEALVEGQSRFVFRVVWSVLRNVQDAEDVVQETFLKLYRSGAWEQMEDERAFLARAAWRLALDRVRSRGREMSADLPGEMANPERAAIASDWNGAVQKLMDALPEELRQPLALSALEEMTSREIAGVMGIHEGTVRTRILRARQILKQKMGSLHGRP